MHTSIKWYLNHGGRVKLHFWCDCYEHSVLSASQHAKGPWSSSDISLMQLHSQCQIFYGFSISFLIFLKTKDKHLKSGIICGLNIQFLHFSQNQLRSAFSVTLWRSHNSVSDAVWVILSPCPRCLIWYPLSSWISSIALRMQQLTLWRCIHVVVAHYVFLFAVFNELANM